MVWINRASLTHRVNRTGPIVRISPYEVHISDPDYYNTLYSHRSPRDKYYYYLKPFDFPLSAFGTEDARLHRLRRGAMNPFFSRGKILQNEALIQRLVQKLCDKIKDLGSRGEIVPLSLGFTCLATDLITEFAMDRSYGHLDAADWHPHWGQTLKDASELGTVTRQITWILPILKSFPQSWAEKLNPGLAIFYTLSRRTEERIAEVQRARNLMEKEKQTSPGKYTLIDQVLDSKLVPDEKSPSRLAQEIRSAIGAGTETTSNALTVITYHLLSNPDKLARLRNELQLHCGLDEHTEICKLEQLPYLVSCIHWSANIGGVLLTAVACQSSCVLEGLR